MKERNRLGLAEIDAISAVAALFSSGGELSPHCAPRAPKGVPTPHDVVFEAWNAVWEELLAAHNRLPRLRVERRLDRGDDRFEWVLEDNLRG